MMRCLNHCLSCVCVCAAEAISRWHSICPQYYCWHWCGMCIWATLLSHILFHGLSLCGFICFQIAHEILTIRWRSDALWVILIRLWLLYYLQSVVLEICLQSHRYWNTHQDLKFNHIWSHSSPKKSTEHKAFAYNDQQLSNLQELKWG
jgi:hypothetical protein